MTSPLQFKLTTLVKRKPDISEAEFHRYWSEKHPAVVNEWLARHGVIKYVQYHTPSEVREQCKFGIDNVIDFDGYVELTVPNIEALKNAFEDPFYKSHVAPDEAMFIDAQGSRRTFGYEETYIVDGKIVRQ